MSSKQLRDKILLERYKNWRKGQLDNKLGLSMLSPNGDYLDGFHSPDQSIPDFMRPSDLNKIQTLMINN